MIVNQSFSFLVRLILAKLLFPEEFGLIGMATVFIGFVQTINEMGIGAALIQKKEEKLSPIHFSTAFWSGIVWSFLLFLILAILIGPFASWFYEEEKLITLIPVISLSILLSPLNLVNKVQLTRKMDFKSIAKVENISSIISGLLSVFLALNGFGVWALAINIILTTAISIPLYFGVTKWYPKLEWSSEAFKDLFGFGIYTMFTNTINYIINNIDYLLIGKLISATSLGIYTFAFMLTDTFKNKISQLVSKVMYPMYSSLQSDIKYATKVYLKVIEYNCLVIYPFMVYLLLFGEVFIIKVFGQKWDEAIYPIQILSAAVMIQMLVNSNTVFMRGLGFPNLELKLQLFKATIYIPILVAGIYFNGIIGASWSILINRVIAVFITLQVFEKFGVSIPSLKLLSLNKLTLTSLLMAGIPSFLLMKSIQIPLIISTILFFLIYSLSIFYFKKEEIVTLKNRAFKK